MRDYLTYFPIRTEYLKLYNNPFLYVNNNIRQKEIIDLGKSKSFDHDFYEKSEKSEKSEKLSTDLDNPTLYEPKLSTDLDNPTHHDHELSKRLEKSSASNESIDIYNYTRPKLIELYNSGKINFSDHIFFNDIENNISSWNVEHCFYYFKKIFLCVYGSKNKKKEIGHNNGDLYGLKYTKILEDNDIKKNLYFAYYCLRIRRYLIHSLILIQLRYSSNNIVCIQECSYELYELLNKETEYTVVFVPRRLNPKCIRSHTMYSGIDEMALYNYYVDQLNDISDLRFYTHEKDVCGYCTIIGVLTIFRKDVYDLVTDYPNMIIGREQNFDKKIGNDGNHVCISYESNVLKDKLFTEDILKYNYRASIIKIIHKDTNIISIIFNVHLYFDIQMIKQKFEEIIYIINELRKTHDKFKVIIIGDYNSDTDIINRFNTMILETGVLNNKIDLVNINERNGINNGLNSETYDYSISFEY